MTKIKLLSAYDLKTRLKKIMPFMSTEEDRACLCGVYLEYKGGTLTATATNGHILCTMEWDLPEENERQEPFSVICPSSAVKNLVKIISAKQTADGGAIVNILDNGKTIEFDLFYFKYKASCVDGSYPDYKKLVPEGNISVQEGFDANYLTSVLKAMGRSIVDINVDDTKGAHLFSSQNEDGVRCVVMPKRQ